MSEAPVIAGDTRRGRDWLWAYLACAAVVLAYVRIVGPVAFVNDSFFLCEPAKFLAGKSLPGGAALYFFYRPLISFLWLPAYVFDRPELIVAAIQTINALIYALAIWPTLSLLRGYAGLSPRQSLAAAILFVLSPCVLIYSPMLLTEAIYAPIFLALVWTTWRRDRQPGLGVDVACGLLIGLCYLSRHAASIVVAAWAAAEAVRLVAPGSDWKARLARFRSAAVVVAVSALPIGGWMLASRSIAQGENGGAAGALMQELADGHEYALIWALNLIQYLLWTPAGFVLLAGALVMLASPLRVSRDAPALFVWGTTVLAILSTVIFQGSHWGDRSLCLNRYVAPYVIPLSIVGWRYLQGANGKYLLAAEAVFLVSMGFGFPRALNTHFPDFLAWTKLVSADSAWTNALPIVFLAAVGIGLLCCWRRSGWTMLCVVGFFSLAWDAAAAAFWRNYSISVARPILECAGKVWTARDGVALEVDRHGALDRDVVLFRCFYPRSLPQIDADNLLSLAKGMPPLRLVTRDRFSVGESFAQGAPVWEFPGGFAERASTLANVSAFDESKIVPCKIGGRREKGVFVTESVTIDIVCAGQAAAGHVRLRMISPQQARTLRVTTAPGHAAESTLSLPPGLPKAGWREVLVPVDLQPGKNSLTLTAQGPIRAFGKRQIRFIMSSEVDIETSEK